MKRGIILETNCFSHVFNKSDQHHEEFEPVYDWLHDRRGVLVYGGNKYKTELIRSKVYLRLFNRLKNQGLVFCVDDTKVNSEEARIRALIPIPDFDDPHLPAIVIVSGCRVICSVDKRCFPYLKDKNIYPKAGMRPKFYSQKQNKKLLFSQYTLL